MTSSTTKLTRMERAVHVPDAVELSYALCKRIARKRARNFYYGMKLTPEPKRSAMYAIYAWMRAADDLADAQPSPSEVLRAPGTPGGWPVPRPGEATPNDNGVSDAGIGGPNQVGSTLTPALSQRERGEDPAFSAGEREKAIDAFRARTLEAIDPTGGVPADDTAHAAMWPAVRHTLLTYRIPVEYLLAMIDGQLLDQHRTRYATFSELDEYCYKVAGVVGLTCITVWGFDDGDGANGDAVPTPGAASASGAASTGAASNPSTPSTVPSAQLAIYRGAALQLTNILRDVVEDARRDRVYLPADELQRFGYRDADEFRDAALSGLADERFDRLMQFQVARAQRFYDDASPLEARLTPDCRPTCWAITQIYRGLLSKIAADPRRVLRRRVRLSSFNKLRIAMTATMRRRSS